MATRYKVPLITSDATLAISSTKTVNSTVNTAFNGADMTFTGSGTAEITFPSITSNLTSQPGTLTNTRVPFADSNGQLIDDANMTFATDTLTVTKISSAGITGTGYITLKYAGKTTTYVIDATDYIVNCTSGTFSVTLPTAASIAGRTYVIKNSGSGVITLDGDASETIDGATTQTLNQYDCLTVVSDGTNWIII